MNNSHLAKFKYPGYDRENKAMLSVHNATHHTETRCLCGQLRIGLTKRFDQVPMYIQRLYQLFTRIAFRIVQISRSIHRLQESGPVRATIGQR